MRSQCTYQWTHDQCRLQMWRIFFFIFDSQLIDFSFSFRFHSELLRLSHFNLVSILWIKFKLTFQSVGCIRFFSCKIIYSLMISIVNEIKIPQVHFSQPSYNCSVCYFNGTFNEFDVLFLSNMRSKHCLDVWLANVWINYK